MLSAAVLIAPTVAAMSLLAWVLRVWIVEDRPWMAEARLLALETTADFEAAVAPVEVRLVNEVCKAVIRLLTSSPPATVPRAAS
jgi:hypothetical protein